MTIQDRIEVLEQTSRTHDVMLNLLITIGERQQALLEEIQRDSRQTRELLQETRRDTQQTQRLWLRLAQKNGWLDDDDQ